MGVGSREEARKHTDDQDRDLSSMDDQKSLCATAPEGRGIRERERGGEEKGRGEKWERKKEQQAKVGSAVFLVVLPRLSWVFFGVGVYPRVFLRIVFGFVRFHTLIICTAM